jgi:hypothetical protein
MAPGRASARGGSPCTRLVAAPGPGRNPCTRPRPFRRLAVHTARSTPGATQLSVHRDASTRRAPRVRMTPPRGRPPRTRPAAAPGPGRNPCTPQRPFRRLAVHTSLSAPVAAQLSVHRDASTRQAPPVRLTPPPGARHVHASRPPRARSATLYPAAPISAPGSTHLAIRARGGATLCTAGRVTPAGATGPSDATPGSPHVHAPRPHPAQGATPVPRSAHFGTWQYTPRDPRPWRRNSLYSGTRQPGRHGSV